MATQQYWRWLWFVLAVGTLLAIWFSLIWFIPWGGVQLVLAVSTLVTPFVVKLIIDWQDPDGAARRRSALGRLWLAGLCISAAAITLPGIEIRYGTEIIQLRFRSPSMGVALLAAGVILALLGLNPLPARPRLEGDSVEPEKQAVGADVAPQPPPKPVPLPERPVFRERIWQLFAHRGQGQYQMEGVGESGLLRGRYTDDLGRTHAVLVLPDDSGERLTAARLEAFAQQLRGAELEGEPRLFYIVERPAQHAELSANHTPLEGGGSLTHSDEEALWDQLVDFRPYLRSLIKDFEEAPLPYTQRQQPLTLAQTYVEQAVRLNGEIVQGGRLGELLDEWLATRGTAQMALLADYGMGKTSAVRRQAARLAKAYLAEEGAVRIPIVIFMAGRYPSADRDGSELLDHFIQSRGLRCNAAALRLLAEAGRLLFILDGFDEMQLVGERQIRDQHFAALWRLAEGPLARNKLLFSGRPGYFPTQAEREATLRLCREIDAATLTGQIFCSEINLEPLDEGGIERSFAVYFERSQTTRFHELLKRHPTLLELAARPALMHIIRETLDQDPNAFDAGNKINAAGLLRLYTDHWIIREAEKRRGFGQAILVQESDLREFSRHLAEWLFLESGEPAPVDSERLLERFRVWFPKHDGLSNLQVREGIKTTLQNCTYLVPVGQEGFAFAHKPFFEYFLADTIVQLMRSGELGHHQLLNRPWPRQLSRHVADLLATEIPISTALLEQIEPGRSLTRWVARLRRSPKSARCLNAMQVDLYRGMPGDKVAQSCRLPLLELFRLSASAKLDLRGGNLCDLRLVGGWRRILGSHWREGAVRYPRKLLDHTKRYLAMDLRLVGIDLSEAALSGTDFQGLALPGGVFQASDLQRADLSGVILEGANLGGANLGGAHLVLANLESANLEGAYLEGAYLFSANLGGANLEGAYLEGANLKDTNLFLANLKDANLLGADLRSAKLEGANLEGANLEGAYLRGANLEGTNLEGANLVGANLGGTNLEGANFEGTNLRGRNLRGAKLEDANLVGANLGGANLEGVNLFLAKLEGANLEGANLVGAKLRGANLKDTNLFRANLEGTNLKGANLEGANLEDTNLRGALLEGAILRHTLLDKRQ